MYVRFSSCLISSHFRPPSLDEVGQVLFILAQPPLLGPSAESKLPGTNADSMFSSASIQITYLGFLFVCLFHFFPKRGPQPWHRVARIEESAF